MWYNDGKMRKIEFKNGEYYHIYNRGVDKREVFSCEDDYLRFLKSLREFNTTVSVGGLYKKYLQEKRTLDVTNRHATSTNLVDIIAYCLNPNHYHLILKQLEDKGIEKFMKKVGNGYTKYYNYKNKRSGVLFQGAFKSIHIDSNEYLLYLSAYVNKNNFIHGYNKTDWKYSSLLDYLGERNGDLCNKNVILKQFRNLNDYKEFLKNNAIHLKEKKEMNKYILE